jgi:hypothetical protein
MRERKGASGKSRDDTVWTKKAPEIGMFMIPKTGPFC